MGARVRQRLLGASAGVPAAARGALIPMPGAAGKGVLLWCQEYFNIIHNIPIPMIFPYCEMEFGYGNCNVDGGTPCCC